MQSQRRIGPAAANLVVDALECPDCERLVRLVLEEADAAAQVLGPHDADEAGDAPAR
jgi:hypothetical protein